jgi:hypothetical protein
MKLTKLIKNILCTGDHEGGLTFLGILIVLRHPHPMNDVKNDLKKVCEFPPMAPFKVCKNDFVPVLLKRCHAIQPNGTNPNDTPELPQSQLVIECCVCIKIHN